jgi:hypothetical protein
MKYLVFLMSKRSTETRDCWGTARERARSETRLPFEEWPMATTVGRLVIESIIGQWGHHPEAK